MWRLMHTVEEVRGGEDITMMSPTYVTYTHEAMKQSYPTSARKSLNKQEQRMTLPGAPVASSSANAVDPGSQRSSHSHTAPLRDV